jgi:hypothetical protein
MLRGEGGLRPHRCKGHPRDKRAEPPLTAPPHVRHVAGVEDGPQPHLGERNVETTRTAIRAMHSD